MPSTSSMLSKLLLALLPPHISSPEIFQNKEGEDVLRWTKGDNIFELTMCATGECLFQVHGEKHARHEDYYFTYFDGVDLPLSIKEQAEITLQYK